MEPNFWHERWAQNQIGFHQERVNPLLVDFWDRVAGRSTGEVFVPLCGKSLDMVWLNQRGHTILGVELSPIAVKDFFRKQSLRAIRQTSDHFLSYETGGVRLLCGNFFDLRADQLVDVRFVYDRAALIAMPPELQTAYVTHLLHLLPNRPPILLITLEYDPNEMAGPPFSIPEDRVVKLFEAAYDIELLSARETLDEAVGLRDRGLTRLVEKVYQLGTASADGIRCRQRSWE